MLWLRVLLLSALVVAFGAAKPTRRKFPKCLRCDRDLRDVRNGTLWRQPGGTRDLAALQNGTRGAPRDTLVALQPRGSPWQNVAMMLVSLGADVRGRFDVVLVRDAAVGLGVVQMAEAWGVKVIPEDAAPVPGPVALWRYFAANPAYQCLVLCTRDLLVPPGVVGALAAALKAGPWGLLLPLTSYSGRAGAGGRLHDHYRAVPRGRGHWSNAGLNYNLVQQVLSEGWAEPPPVRPVNWTDGLMVAVRKEALGACGDVDLGALGAAAAGCGLRAGVYPAAFVYPLCGLAPPEDAAGQCEAPAPGGPEQGGPPAPECARCNQDFAFPVHDHRWRQPGGTHDLAELRSGRPEPVQTVVSIHTARSAWQVTALMLVSLAADVHHRFDVLIVDDHSVRIDIEARARAWGVLTQSWGNRTEGRKGNTQTWNLAWQYLLAHDYQYLVLSNNDLIVPEGTVTTLAHGLSLGWHMLLPMVSYRGTRYGLHRLQDHYGPVPNSPAHWTNLLLNYNMVQTVLTQGLPANNTRLQPVRYPNGYMMGLNKERMRQCEHSPGHLFNPQLKNIGNEDDLAHRCRWANIGVHVGAFVFHIKGFTLYQKREQRDDTNDTTELDEKPIV